MPIGYKVVCDIDGRLESSSQLRAQGCICYIKGEAVTPKDGCGPLMLFSDIRDARIYDSGSICEAFYLPSTQEAAYYTNTYGGVRSETPDGVKEWFHTVFNTPMCGDVILADAVVLLTQVK